MVDRKAQRRSIETCQLVAAAIGVVSLPVAGDSTTTKREPVLLVRLAVDRKLWVAWLTDAMLRSGKGMRKPSQRRTKGDPRRADKPGTTKVERRLLRGMRS